MVVVVVVEVMIEGEGEGVKGVKVSRMMMIVGDDHSCPISRKLDKKDND